MQSKRADAQNPIKNKNRQEESLHHSIYNFHGLINKTKTSPIKNGNYITALSLGKMTSLQR
jgi:hypothetical protein